MQKVPQEKLLLVIRATFFPKSAKQPNVLGEAWGIGLGRARGVTSWVCATSDAPSSCWCAHPRIQPLPRPWPPSLDGKSRAQVARGGSGRTTLARSVRAAG